MEALNFAAIAWLIPVPLFLAFGILALLALFNRVSKPIATAFSMGGVLLSTALALIVFVSLMGSTELGEHPVSSMIAWIPAGTTALNVGVVVDPLNLPFLLMVPVACTLIFLYSTSYMGADPRYSRFMTYLSLFAGSMLGLVVSDNLLTFFVFWELMGFCSYALIGFFYQKPSAYKAAVKAFMTTRVGDMLLLLGIVYLYTATGTLNFREIMGGEQVLEHLVSEPAVLGGFFGLGLSAASAIGLLIFGGTVGKSAQWPLHVWLPDAMEGPTPVSAMIHAATMVSAGVLLSLRIFPLLQVTMPHTGGAGMGTAFNVIGIIGAFTALIAALIAVAQYDIKRVLAYSTISQLGFMVAAVGMGAYVAATFHLLTHAFFKALLFLGSGSVIHGVEHGHHHLHAGHDDHAAAGHGADAGHGGHDAHAAPEPEFDAQDMRNMGGLRTRMPITFWTFLIGGLALSGFPFITAGFWSKDEILGAAYQGLTEGQLLHSITFFVLVFTATLTAFYTMRQISMTFLGKARTEAAAHASENAWPMTVPLIILAVFALGAGLMNIPAALGGSEWLGKLLEPMLEAAHKVAGKHAHVFSFVPMIVSIVIGLLGLALGYLVYGMRPLQAGQTDPVEKLGGVFTFLHRRMLWDELYRAIFITPLQKIADNYTRVVDKGVIDFVLEQSYEIGTMIADAMRRFDLTVVTGASNAVGNFFRDLGNGGRELQSGQVQNYLLSALIAAVVMMAFFLLIQ